MSGSREPQQIKDALRARARIVECRVGQHACASMRVLSMRIVQFSAVP